MNTEIQFDLEDEVEEDMIYRAAEKQGLSQAEFAKEASLAMAQYLLSRKLLEILVLMKTDPKVFLEEDLDDCADLAPEKVIELGIAEGGMEAIEFFLLLLCYFEKRSPLFPDLDEDIVFPLLRR